MFLEKGHPLPTLFHLMVMLTHPASQPNAPPPLTPCSKPTSLTNANAHITGKLGGTLSVRTSQQNSAATQHKGICQT
ncbi:MAG: hypothetical protein ACK44E_05105 [Anaerolineales bacterium]